MTNPGKMSLVSVIMNAYYSEEFLAEAIASVVAQTYSNWEIVLWENESSDGAREIVESFNDLRIRYFFAPDKVSLYESRMNAFQQARGELVAFLDCDDLWLPEKLAMQIRVFQNIACTVSSTDYFMRKGSQKASILGRNKKIFRTYREPQDSLLRVIEDYRVGMSTLMIRASTAQKWLPKNPPPFNMIEDVDIVTRMMAVGTLVPIRETLTIYRLHLTNYSKQVNPFRDEFQAWIANLSDLRVSADVRMGLTVWGESQILNSRYRSAILSRNRKIALQSCFLMPFSLATIKRLLLLALPWKLTQEIIR